MTARTRKLIGTVLLLLFLGAYTWAVVIIGAGRITLARHWAQLAFPHCRPSLGHSGAPSHPLDAEAGGNPRGAQAALTGPKSPTVGPYLRARRLLLKLTTAVLSLVRAL